jgi:hypothetical protein
VAEYVESFFAIHDVWRAVTVYISVRNNDGARYSIYPRVPKRAPWS